MVSRMVLTLSVCAGFSQAFANTSPFFAFSNSLPSKQSSSDSFLRAEDLHTRLSADWINCKASDLFLVVSQPGAAASDYASPNSAPYLRRNLKNPAGSTSLAVSDIIGAFSASELRQEIQQQCGLSTQELDPSGPLNIQHSYPQLLSIQFQPLPESTADRSMQLERNDKTLDSILQGANAKSHTVLYVTTPAAMSPSKAKHHLSQHLHASHRPSGSSHADASPHAEQQLDYDSEEQFPALIHLDMKRDMLHRAVRDASSGTLKDAGLFETYNFLNHGVFMGGLVVVLLLSILYIGLSAIGSIEITPFAFSKEMGPSGQKKQN